LSFEITVETLEEIFASKLAIKNIEFGGTTQLFPPDIIKRLHPYWEIELGRLPHPAPKMEKVLKELSGSLGFLDSE